ncbi:hypothetical protein BSKO_02752 [Bryopsis sp. KO-2023]|nr:hypothetical protein BSKO_02752 [Bryopsis sp. KO-2023]
MGRTGTTWSRLRKDLNIEIKMTAKKCLNMCFVTCAAMYGMRCGGNAARRYWGGGVLRRRRAHDEDLLQFPCDEAGFVAKCFFGLSKRNHLKHYAREVGSTLKIVPGIQVERGETDVYEGASSRVTSRGASTCSSVGEEENESIHQTVEAIRQSLRNKHCCNVQRNEADGAVDVSSTTGWKSASSKANETSLVADQCKSDCQTSENCSLRTIDASCTNGPKDGSDVCMSVKECKDPCEQRAYRIEEFNARCSPCTPADECARQFARDSGGSAGKCKRMSSTMKMGGQTPTCDGICVVAVKRTSSTATLDEKDDNSLVQLDFPAPRGSFPCSAVSDRPSVDSVGGYAQCFATGKELKEYFLEENLIHPGDTPTLSTGQTFLMGILETPFAETIMVVTCDSCVSPVALTLDLKLVSPGCGARFHASNSMEPGKIGLTYSSATNTEKCYRSGISGPVGVDPSCVELGKNSVQAHSTEPSLELVPTTDSYSTQADYQLCLEATNLFSLDSFLDIVLTRTAGGAATVFVVGIFGEQKRDFEISQRSKISAFAEKSSLLCDSFTVDHIWISIEASLLGAIPHYGYSRKTLVVPGQENDPELVTYLLDLSGGLQSYVRTTALGSLLEAKLDGPTGHVVTAIHELSTMWRCVCKAFFTGKSQPITEVAKVWIPKEALVPGTCHFYMATISSRNLKQTRSSSEVNQFRPQQNSGWIATGRSESLCGFPKCLVTFDGGEIINAILKVDENHKDGTSISGECSEQQDLANNVLGDLQTRNLAKRSGVVSGGAEVECTVILIEDGVRERGEVLSMSFVTNKSPPYSVDVVTGDCFADNDASKSRRHQFAPFRGKVKILVDDAYETMHEFGEAVGTRFILFQRGCSTLLQQDPAECRDRQIPLQIIRKRKGDEFNGLGWGGHTLVLRHTDAAGGIAQEEETEMVLESEEDIDIVSRELDAMLDGMYLDADEDTRSGGAAKVGIPNFESGNPVKVLKESGKGVQLLKLAEKRESALPTKRR